MNVVLMSDSHDNLPMLHKAVEFCNDQHVGHVLHAGDLVAPFVTRALDKLKAPLTIVYGNNDGERKGLEKAFSDKIFEPPYELELDGRSVIMLHDPVVLDALVQSGRYDLILYGHLHEIDIRPGPPIVVNPGELSGWLSGKSTMATWDTETDEIKLVTLN
ncbi:YfcE family phosphodiesterase [candidate division KSB1 bacterium]|nr:YfcE family phosphodiesterase [candidate division KSB1 bacterium]